MSEPSQPRAAPEGAALGCDERDVLCAGCTRKGVQRQKQGYQQPRCGTVLRNGAAKNIYKGDLL